MCSEGPQGEHRDWGRQAQVALEPTKDCLFLQWARVWPVAGDTGNMDLWWYQVLSDGLFSDPQVAPGSARPWPALRSLLHRNLVLRTHQPARWGQLQEIQESTRELLSGALESLNNSQS